MSQSANTAAQEHLVDNLNAGDVDTAVESFAEDAVDHDPAPDQGPGRQGFRNFWNAMLAAFPDARIEPRNLVSDDDHINVAYTLTGTHRGEFQGIAPTGRSIQINGIQMARFQDGKIVERWGSSDELGIVKQLGAA